MKKVFVCLLVVALLLASVPIAYADGYVFDGTCSNNFSTHKFNKQYDTTLEVCLFSIAYSSSNSGTPAANVQFYVGTHAVGLERSLSIVTDYLNNYGVRSTSSYTGKAYAKIINNSSPKYAIHATGAFFLYHPTKDPLDSNYDPYSTIGTPRTINWSE